MIFHTIGNVDGGRNWWYDRAMKRFLSILLIAFAVSFCFADEYTLGEISVSGSLYGMGETVRLKYDDKENTYYLQVSSLMYLGWIYLSEDQLKTLRATVDKAIEWGKIAESKKLEVSKEIPDSKLTSKVAWRFLTDHNNFYFADGLNLKWTFQSTDYGSWYLTFQSSEVSSRQNQFMTYSVDTISMSRLTTEDFKKIISEEGIKKVKAEHEKKKKEADELFN